LESAGYTPYPHQLEGIQWLNTRTVGILGDDPGLGKTLQFIAHMMSTPLDKNLIVCPISLMTQWYELIKKVWKNATVCIDHGNESAKTIKELQNKVEEFDVVICGYSKLWKSIDGQYHQTPYHHIKWNRVILDECHCIRNEKSKVFKGCYDIKASFRWGITGTPINNNVKDLQNLFRFLHLPKDQIKYKLEELTKTYLLRRNKTIMADAYNDLNIKIENVCFTNDKEREFYFDVEQKVKAEMEQLIANGDKQGLMMELFELLLRLRQASIHPNIVLKGLAKKFNRKFTNKWKGPSTKITKLIELFDNHQEEDRSIVFCQFKDEMNVIEKHINAAFPKLRVSRFDGELSVDQRLQMVRDSMAGKIDVMLIQIMAGGVGLNLQAFNKVYIMSPNWNPANEIQAIARAHRTGQTRPVEVVKIVLNDSEKPTIDDRILQLQMTKRDTMVEILGDETLKFSEEFTNKHPIAAGLSLRDIKVLLR